MGHMNDVSELTSSEQRALGEDADLLYVCALFQERRRTRSIDSVQHCGIGVSIMHMSMVSQLPWEPSRTIQATQKVHILLMDVFTAPTCCGAVNAHCVAAHAWQHKMRCAAETTDGNADL